MSIWILHQNLTPEEEMLITKREELKLPLDGLPDLSTVHTPAACRKLLVALYPDEPPETITRRLERTWQVFDGMHKEDVLVVPLQSRQEMVLAEVTHPYRYRVGDNGEDIHTVNVKWHEKRLPFRAFGRNKDMLAPDAGPIAEVTAQDLRVRIRDCLPHPWNRFVWLKWLMIVFLGWQALSFLLRSFGQP